MRDDKTIKTIKIHENRIKKQNYLTKNSRLIISPIRASDYRSGDIFDNPRSDFKFFINGYKEVVCGKLDDPKEEYKTMKTMNEPVGFFVAACPEGQDFINMGFSICSPNDDFSKDTGLLKAFRFGYALQFDKLEPYTNRPDLKLNVKRIMSATNDFEVPSVQVSSLTVRYWRMPLRDQYELFVHKCKQYYKQFKDRWSF